MLNSSTGIDVIIPLTVAALTPADCAVNGKDASKQRIVKMRPRVVWGILGWRLALVGWGRG